MPATITTTEKFDKSATSKIDMDDLVRLRLKAGAIRSRYREEGDSWVLDTEWNVFGQQ